MSSVGFDLTSLLAGLVGGPVKISETLPENIKRPVDRFHYNILVLCDILKDIVNEAIKCGIKTNLTPSIIDAFMTYLSKMTDGSKEEMISGFISKSSSLWDQIYDKKMDVILKGVLSIFSGSNIPSNIVNEIINLITANRPESKEEKKIPLVTSEQMNDIWDNLHGDISLSIRHIYEMRKMKVVKSINPEGKEIQKMEATVVYHSEVKIKPAAIKWKINF